MTNINQADGTGKIDVGGTVSPVSYHVIARPLDDGARTSVHIEVSLPRDWLMARGFKSEAVLIREDGSRQSVHAEDHLDATAPLSVLLTTPPESVASESELGQRFPELVIH
jgi:hypothetical protein